MEQLKRGVIVDDEVVKKKDGVLVDGVFGVVDSFVGEWTVCCFGFA